MPTQYDGWSNRQTQIVAKTLSRKHWQAVAADYVHEVRQEFDGEYSKEEIYQEATGRLVADFMDALPTYDDLDAVYQDLLADAVSEIRWYEIADSFISGVVLA